ncbi:hypothetical protein B0T11DRAFT_302576 [Plectosphaerella cucumerina]|uniref:Secreted protein n=1 Tax=Plectosphaerella cucumerina TaxID=40658 RepID=A0A8K0T4E0_9PEZI|nr:hypothetical protein B0T11DRAFT_302576 [Plectosphaerella cucumerina]
MRLSLSLPGLAAIACLLLDVAYAAHSNAAYHDACACHNGGEYNWRMTPWANEGDVVYNTASGRCQSNPLGGNFLEGGDMNQMCKLGMLLGGGHFVGLGEKESGGNGRKVAARGVLTRALPDQVTLQSVNVK